MGIVDAGGGSVNYMIEIPNRGKKSIGVDLMTPGGQEVVRELAKTCDVFLTSYLPNRRKKMGIDVDDIRAVNPNIVYVRGSGHGPKGSRFRQARVRRGVLLGARRHRHGAHRGRLTNWCARVLRSATCSAA